MQRCCRSRTGATPPRLCACASACEPPVAGSASPRGEERPPVRARILATVAVNTRVLIGSLAAAVGISIGGGFALSRSDDSENAAPSTAQDDVTITSSGVYAEPGIETNARVEGTPLADVKLRDRNGNEISTTTLTGQPLVINVWTTSCIPCTRELPALAAAHDEFGESVRFVGVNSGGDTADEARSFAEKYGVNYETLSDPNGDFLVALGISGFPYTLFVASDGTIVAQKGIELSLDTIRTTITDTLLSG